MGCLLYAWVSSLSNLTMYDFSTILSTLIVPCKKMNFPTSVHRGFCHNAHTETSCGQLGGIVAAHLAVPVVPHANAVNKLLLDSIESINDHAQLGNNKLQLHSLQINTHTHAHKQARTHTGVHPRTHTHARTYACTHDARTPHVWAHARTHACKRTLTCTHACACT